MQLSIPFGWAARKYQKSLETIRYKIFRSLLNTHLLAHRTPTGMIGLFMDRIESPEWKAQARQSNIDYLAQKFVEIGHLLDGQSDIHLLKLEIINESGDIDPITLSELNGCIAERLDQLPFHGYSTKEQKHMIRNTRLTLSPPSTPTL